jgi:hypothetical protein
MEVTSSRARADAHAFYLHMGYTDICHQAGRFFKTIDRAETVSHSQGS